MINEKSAKGRKEIVVTSEKVTRPVKPWTTDVQRFLTYMTVEKQVSFVPKLMGIDDNGNGVIFSWRSLRLSTS
ncbi:hypothetical protein [Pseudolactococcus laudensis]|uniref:hypothetical protein n=1 Tax=Pseudolactococcus laudensis TaxID=1494461 RepID=UPI003F9B900B